MISVQVISRFLIQQEKTISFQTENALEHKGLVTLCNKMRSMPPNVIILRDISSSSYLIATDIIRSIPVFYCLKDDILYISDRTDDLLPYSSMEISDFYSQEFLSTGYTTGDNTIIKDIKQLQAGEYILVTYLGLKKEFYQKYLTNHFYDFPYDSLKNKFVQILEDVFKSLITNLGGRPALIPLSGGYDSRLILYWLKRLKYPKVECFTYGRINNIEVENAKQVACNLNYPWRFIEYTGLNLKDYIESEDFNKYFPYMANHSSMFYMQEYFAIKYLKDNSLITSESTFIPGHSGDFIAGSHLFSGLRHQLTIRKIAKIIYQKHFQLINNNSKDMFIPTIENELDRGLYHSHLIYEDWDMRERQAKFIVNSARIYSFFGYNYLLPFYDHRFIDFFKAIPFEYKLYKKLYSDVLKSLFADYELNFKNEIQPKASDYRFHHFKQGLIDKLPFLNKYKKLPLNDTHCYQEITDVMKTELKNKNKKIIKPFSYNGYIVQWYLNSINKE